jgi:hypothetical protein
MAVAEVDAVENAASIVNARRLVMFLKKLARINITSFQRRLGKAHIAHR